MTPVLKIMALLVAAAGAAMLLRLYRPEFAMVLTLAAGAAALVCILPYFSALMQELFGTFSDTPQLSLLAQPTMKIVATAYLAQFASDVCCDCGEKALAQKIALCARVGILALCVPSIRYILEAITSLLEGGV